MILLDVRDLRKHYGPEAVLDGATAEVRPGERIALVGPNGAGKSTLLKIVAGLEEADAGEVALHSSAELRYLEQQPEFAADAVVWDVAAEGLARLYDLQQRAEQIAARLAAASDEASRAELAEEYDLLQHHLHQEDAYQVEHRIERVLQGLGFSPEEFRQPVVQLSGGQQNRLLLARLLLAEPDVMLLDEPNNHLDVDAVEWLEKHLASSSAAMILVSHDRYFLDKIATRTLELFRGTLDSYAGNYSAYRRQKAERLEVQRRAYDKQQIEIAKTEDFIRRNHHGQKHAQAEDRKKKLAKIEPVEPPREIHAPPMGFPDADRTGDVALRVEHLSKRYATPLFQDLSFDVLRGERWGIVGPNGTGKTTLLKCLLGLVDPEEGKVIFGAHVRPGYFDQQLSGLADDVLVVDSVRPPNREMHEPRRRGLLARFGMTGDLVFQSIASLSGGERNRTALARLAALEANFLILDEPTNHLDLWSREALEQSLREFTGTVIFVSHDRYFVNRLADHLLVVEPGGFRVVAGDYDLYRRLVDQGMAAGDRAAVAAKAEDRDEVAAEARRGKTDKPRRKRRFPYRKPAEIEAEIFSLESEKESLQTALCDPDTLRDGDKVRTAQTRMAEIDAALAPLYEHWEEACEMNV